MLNSPIASVAKSYNISSKGDVGFESHKPSILKTVYPDNWDKYLMICNFYRKWPFTNRKESFSEHKHRDRNMIIR